MVNFFEETRGARDQFTSLQTNFFSFVAKCAKESFVKLNPACGRLSGLMVSALVSGSSSPDLSPGHCGVHFTLIVPAHLGLCMGTREINAGGYHVMDQDLFRGE